MPDDRSRIKFLQHSNIGDNRMTNLQAFYIGAIIGFSFMCGTFYQSYKDTPAPLTAEEMNATGPK